MALFGDPVPPVKEKKPKAESGPVVRVETVYKDLFQAKFGFAPTIKFGRDRKALKELLGAWPEDEVLAQLAPFIQRDIRSTRDSFSLYDFCMQAQRLRIERAAGPNGRTAQNVDAAARATGRRGR